MRLYSESDIEAALCLGGFSLASSRSWLRCNFCYQAISLIDAVVSAKERFIAIMYG